jgi:hypothetical protein
MYIQELESAYLLGKIGEIAPVKAGRTKFHYKSTSIVDG